MSFNICTSNVRGLADNTKRRELFHYLHLKKINCAFLQEVHSIKASEKFWSTQWGTKIWFSHGTNKARGVAILLDKTFPFKVHNVLTDNEGRYVMLYGSVENHKILLANVYAPNNDQPDFFERFKKDTPDYYTII